VYWNVDGSSSPKLILQNLKDRSLIKWAKDGILYMHEQLRDMGQNIATKVTMSRFIWKPNISLQKNQVCATCVNSILWYIFFVIIPNETISFSFI
jgi:hypothetical protein